MRQVRGFRAFPITIEWMLATAGLLAIAPEFALARTHVKLSRSAMLSENTVRVSALRSPVLFKFLPHQDRSERGWSAFKTLVGDVSGDGRSDLIWNATGDTNRTYVGLGQPDGTFFFLAPQDRSERGWSAFKTLVGDINGDGRSDLIWNIAGNANRTYVGLGQPDGTFFFLTHQDRSERGWSAFKTLVGDVNGDGRSDLIWNATGDTNRTYVGLGQPDGTFFFVAPQDRSELGWSAYKTLVGDVNGDGRSDLIWNATGDTNRTYVGLGQPDGTFFFVAPQDRSELGWSAYKTLVGDVNGDGRSDLIWNATGDTNRTYVGLGQPDGTFFFVAYQDRSERGWSAYKTLVGDVNGDGRSDLIWNATGDTNRTFLGLGQPGGTFFFLPHQDRSEREWSAYKTRVGDVNGDGRSDLIWNATSDTNRTYAGLAD